MVRPAHLSTTRRSPGDLGSSEESASPSSPHSPGSIVFRDFSLAPLNAESTTTPADPLLLARYCTSLSCILTPGNGWSSRGNLEQAKAFSSTQLSTPVHGHQQIHLDITTPTTQEYKPLVTVRSQELLAFVLKIRRRHLILLPL